VIGPLDERFFMYCEDVDICVRTWDIGQRVVYMPGAVVTHAIGQSSDKSAEKMIVEFHRSWYEFDKKRHPNDNPLRRAVVFSGLWLRAAVRIFNRRRNDRRDRRKGKR
jgi:GT2 family glycosyltransferase